MPNQGMVAEIIKLAMIRVHVRLREEGMASRMLVQVHDELLLEVPEGELAEAARWWCARWRTRWSSVCRLRSRSRGGARGVRCDA
jgi:DNA polymerase family A